MNLSEASYLCMYISELRNSEERRNDSLLCRRRNGQGVEVSAQNQVKVVVTSTGARCHQAGHSASNDK